MQQLEARMMLASDWQNACNRFDVNDDGRATAIDALLVINQLSRNDGPFDLQPVAADRFPPDFVDPTGDLQVSALDALQVINHLARTGGDAGDALPPATSVNQVGSSLVIEQRCRAILHEGDQFATRFQHEFVVPPQASTLQFSYSVDFDESASDVINDALEISVLDGSGNSLVHRVATNRESAFNFTEGNQLVVGAGTTIDGEKVRIDLSGVPAGTEASLLVRLLNNDGDTETSARVERIEVIPIASDGPVSAVLTPSPGRDRSSVDFGSLSDVTPSLSLEFGTTAFVEQSATLDVDLSLRNVGQVPVRGPVALLIDGVSDPNIRPVGFDGLTPDGVPYVLFATGDAASLEQGSATGARSLRFENASGKPFDFRHTVLSGLNRKPAFIGEPKTEAIVDRNYSAIATAEDPDGDRLLFNLIAGPVGLDVDASTGAITWTPTADDLGNHEIVIQVSDGNGGVAQQLSMLTVTEPPPNRPPVIVSSPEVSASVDDAYVYALLAEDADGDSLSYAIADGPVGLGIDAGGVFTWEPLGVQLGDQSVTVEVTDGQGGTVTQTFVINVFENVGNNGPVFTSEPATIFNLPGATSEPTGSVDPTSITVELGDGEALASSVSITLPDEENEIFADVVFIVDETGNMEFDADEGGFLEFNRSEWLPSTVRALGDQLEEAGIGPNRFALSGFGHFRSISNPVQVREQANVLTNPLSLSGPRGRSYGSLRSADLDGDGDLDVVGSSVEHYVNLNNGDGTFAQEVEYVTNDPDFKGNVEIVDMNRDGVPDIVSVGRREIQVFIGLGDGTFEDVQSYRPPANQGLLVSGKPSLAIGDINSDGAPDVLVGEFGISGAIRLFQLINDGSGNLLEPTVLGFDGIIEISAPNLIDLDQDGALDLVMDARDDGSGRPRAVRSAMGDGTGGFAEPQIIDGPFGDVSFLDVNNDTLPDLLYSDGINNDAFVLSLNDGTGAFGSPTSVRLGGFAGFQSFIEKSAADFNDDGNIDVAVQHGRGISVVFGDGLGGFPTGDEYQLDSHVNYNGASGFDDNSLTVGDFDGDGFVDVIQADSRDSDLRLLRGLGEGRLDGPVYQYVTPKVVAGEAADLNNDGHQDYVSISRGTSLESPKLSVSFGDGLGGFDSRIDFEIDPASVIAVGDVDGDGDIDVAIDQNRTTLAVYQNDGNGELVLGETLGTISMRALSIEDLNADGFQDVIAFGFSNTFIYYGSSAGPFSLPPISITSAEGNFSRPAIADFNGDSFLDIASVTNTTEDLRVTLSTETGQLTSTFDTYGDESPPFSSVAAGDVDADGDIDLYTIEDSRGSVTSFVWLNDGAGVFSLAETQANDGLISGANAVSTDFDGDGLSDLVFSGANTSDTLPNQADLAVLYAEGDGTLSDAIYFHVHKDNVSSPIKTISIADFDNNDSPDLLVGSDDGGSVAIMLNDGFGDLGRFGTAEQVARSVFSLNTDAPVTAGRRPDAYLPIDSALDYVTRPGALTYFVIVSATDRSLDARAPSFADLRDELQSRVAIFDVVLDAEFQDGDERSALAVDAAGTATIIDDNGELQLSDGGQFVSGVGQPDYVDLAASLGGTAWDLDRLRNDEGGVAQQAFIERFIAQIEERAISPITVVASNPNVAFENQTGSLSGVGPGQTGTFDIELTGGIDGEAFDLLFVQEATSTIVGSIPVTINTVYTYDASAIDPDGDALTYRFQQAPAGAEIDSTTGQVTWRPDVAGEFPFQIEAVDPFGSSAVQAFAVTVTSGRANTNPVIETPDAQQATVDEDYALQILATDAEDDQLTFFLTDAPDNLTIDSATGQITWVPDENQVGQPSVTVQVRDGRGGVVETSFSISVREAPRNRSPRIQSDPPIAAAVGQPFIYLATATDQDGHPIRWDLPVGPNGATIDPVTGILVWTPNEFQSRPIDFVVRASDDYGGVDLQRFQIQLDALNTAPIVLQTPDSQLVAGFPHEYQVSAQDGENDPILFELQQPPIPVDIDPQSGLITWTPTIDDVGSYDLTVVVSDNQGNASTGSFTFDVVEDAANAPPTFVNLPEMIHPRVSRDFVLPLQAIDPNGDPLEFELLEGPTGMTVSAAGRLTWRPDANDDTEQIVRVQVSDGRGGVSEATLTALAVPIEQNTSPVIVNQPPASAVFGRIYAHDFIGFDREGDSILWVLARGPLGMSLDGERGTLRWIPQADQLGQHVITVQVLDGQQQNGFFVDSFVIDVRAGNSPPVITSTPPTLAAANQPLMYQVEANDLDGDPLAYVLDSTLGSLDPVTGRFTWTPTNDNVGTNRISLRVSDGIATALQTFDIEVEAAARNRLPVFSSTPSLLATLNELYQYRAVAEDPDGLTVTYELVDPPNGMTIDEASGLVEWTPDSLGQTLVGVRAIDTTGGSVTQNFTIDVREINSQPIITSTPIESVAAGGTYRYDVIASDDDPEPLLFSLRNRPDGMTINEATGQIRWTPQPEQIGDFPFEVIATDPRGASATQVINLSVGADVLGPQIAIEVNPNPVNIGEQVVIQVSAVDDIEVSFLQLAVGDQIVPLDRNGTATIPTTSVGRVDVVVTARDPSGNETQRTEPLFVIDGTDVEAPIVSIASPESGKLVTGFVDVIGAVTDPTLVSYELSVASFTGGPFTTIATGDAEVTNGLLGRFDPSLLINDTYTLRLTATDAGGLTSITESLVEVSSELKIGNFALSFTDLTIPVSGIPITVSRTYDSLTAPFDSELGFGWRMEIKDADLRTTVSRTGAEESLIYNPYFDGARVFITVPGGQRAGFTFRVVPESGVAGRTLGLLRGEFVPDPGIDSRLEAGDFVLRANEFGEVFEYSSGLPYNPASPAFDGQFTLVTKEGLRYNINGETGDLISVKDRNRNELTFTDDGVFSSTGVSVAFERDARGRVTAVIDPLGNRVQYAYDTNGDLVSVTDREGHTTQFRYNEPSRPHYLTEVIDPLGRSGVRSEYDADGRLIRMIDAAGEAITLIHDPDNFVETIENQLGFPTTFEYDNRGNVVTEIDAEGGVTRFTYDDPNDPTLETSITQLLEDGTELTTSMAYDANGNLIAETDPLGRTTLTSFDTFGNVLTITDPLGNTTTSSFDERGNLNSIVDPLGQRTRFTYDQSGNPQSLSLPGGLVERFEYDQRGNILSKTDPLGNVSQFTYDTAGRQLTETRTQTTTGGTRALMTQTHYDAEGRLIAERLFIDGTLDRVSLIDYDAVGKRVAETDPLGRVTRFSYDERGQMKEVIFPDATPEDLSDNPRFGMDYDATGRLTAEIDELGRRTEYRYDANGRPTEVIFPDRSPDDLSDNPKRVTVYDALGRRVEEIDPRGNVTRFELDAAGQRTSVILPDETTDDLSDNPKIQNEFDGGGRLIRRIDPMGQATQFEYDAGGRPVATVASNGSRIENRYDAGGRLTSVLDQLGRITSYEYDHLGRLTAVVQPEVFDANVDARVQPRTEYGYDELGNLVLQRDANGHETRYEYDGQSRRTATILPLGQKSNSHYDAGGNLIRTTDFNGDTIGFEYDERDRLVLKDLPGNFPDLSFAYTVTGQLESVTDGRGITSYSYDVQDRLLARTDPDGSQIMYTYDLTGNRTSVKTHVVGGTPQETHYTFDSQDRHKTVTDPDGDVTEYFYDLSGRWIQTDFPDNTIETRSYDSLSRLTRIERRHATTDAVLAGFAYELDDTGNRVAVDEHDGRRVEYAYDELERLIGETIRQSGSQQAERTIDYIYDGVGNRLRRDDSVLGVTSYTYNENDQLLTESLAGDVTTYQYDSNGNTIARISNTQSVAFDWSPENRLLAVDDNGDGTTDVLYEYQQDGVRVARKEGEQEIRYLVADTRGFAQVLEEYSPTDGLEVTYTHGLDLISQDRGAGEGKSFYVVDGLGSTRALSDRQGDLTDIYQYDAFGRTLAREGTTENVYLFAGEQRDLSTGLDYLRARWLDFGQGRFLSRDSFIGLRDSPLTLHRYLYANANPVRFVDPSGLFGIIDVQFTLATRSSLLEAQLAQGLTGLGSAVEVLAISKLLIEPAVFLRSFGINLIASGRKGGIDLVNFGNRWSATGFRLVQESIKKVPTTQDSVNSLFDASIEVQVGGDAVGFELECSVIQGCSGEIELLGLEQEFFTQGVEDTGQVLSEEFFVELLQQRLAFEKELTELLLRINGFNQPQS